MIWLHHLSHWLYRRRIPVLPKIIDRSLFLLTGCSIPASCSIVKGSYFAPGGGGAVINGDCLIGDRVSIGQGITIGGSFGSGVPTIGSDVWISAGSRVLGDIKVGNNVIIGANSVVIRDVPDNSVVAGVPARLIRQLSPGALDTLSGSIRER